MSPIIIIGAGHAGITLVRQLRMKDKYLPIILISQDTVHHYYKPSLSKALSLGKSPHNLVMSTMSELTEELNIKILENTKVTSVFSNKQKIIIQGLDQSPEILPYQSLVFAVGARPIDLNIAGDAQQKIHSVNNLSDYQNFRKSIQNKKRVLVIGAGFVGCEFASDLSLAGFKVDVIDRGSWPLQKSLPEPLGKAIAQSMEKTPVTWHFNDQVISVNKKNCNHEPVLEASLQGGQVIETDAVLSAVGIKPCISLAEKSGIHTNKGIVVNDFSQTNLANIYALGDCVEYQSTLLPFIAPATSMAKSLANTLLAKPSVINIPSLSVAVKIATCPTIICPPVNPNGHWVVSGDNMDWQAKFIDENGRTLGFALTGKSTANKHSFTQECLAPFTSQNNGLSHQVDNIPKKRTAITV